MISFPNRSELCHGLTVILCFVSQNPIQHWAGDTVYKHHSVLHFRHSRNWLQNNPENVWEKKTRQVNISTAWQQSRGKRFAKCKKLCNSKSKVRIFCACVWYQMACLWPKVNYKNFSDWKIKGQNFPVRLQLDRTLLLWEIGFSDFRTISASTV